MGTHHLTTNECSNGSGMFGQVLDAVNTGVKIAGAAHTAYKVVQAGRALIPMAAAFL